LNGSTSLVGPRLFSVSWSIFFYNRQDSLNEWSAHRKASTETFGREVADNFAQRPPWGLRFFNVQ
jgi:hypothetical protein